MLALPIVLAACGGSSSTGSGTPAAKVQSGGTLRIGMVDDPGLDVRDPNYMAQHHWAFLNRTLYTYKLTPDEGEPVPDLAVGPPEISADGLKYTVHLKHGLHYAPPYAKREIVAQDVAYSLDELADPKAGTVSAGTFAGIGGIDPSTGKRTKGTDHVTGVTTPDKYTIVFRLTERKGDFIHKLAWPAMSPAPPGAYKGHEKDYGRFLISSGPYMVEGSDKLDPAAPKPLSGYVPGRSLTLVRNPSWERSTDDVRQANPDRIEFSFGDTDETIAQKVTNGDLDLMLVTQAPPDVVRKYRTDPTLKSRLHINPKVSVRITTINVAQPPFDDVHVRRAVNFVVSREDIRRADGGEATGELAYHRIPPSLMGGELKDYDAYATSSPDEALQKAMDEMRQSKYDPGKTGKCTDPACDNIRAIPADTVKPETNIIRQDLAKIGLNLKVETYSADAAFGKCNDPEEHVALCTELSFGASVPDARGLASDVITANIGPNGCCNVGLIGVPKAQLQKFGYDAEPTKSFDAEYDHCNSLTGEQRNPCFAQIDKEVSDLATSVPLLFPNQREIVSDRVTNYTYDFYGYASLNRIALSSTSP
jgi:peptide/nickel transport system substrate-binding protein